ncbi:hypothetical protein CLF_106935 [Clonorchis sinensis]|uniref:Uncharacterized protein n=1 Tax=Clonorchis sinensis TaxID=79923 RepID=G7YFY5_CLOSI|nr:hypothetical protein CLF_106935 [Clonorchis sinensis]
MLVHRKNRKIFGPCIAYNPICTGSSVSVSVPLEIGQQYGTRYIRLEQLDSARAIVLPSGGMAARHWKGVAAERLILRRRHKYRRSANTAMTIPIMEMISSFASPQEPMQLPSTRIHCDSSPSSSALLTVTPNGNTDAALPYILYDHIADHTDYESAIDTLRKLYVRPKNVIYARYLLQTYKQENGQDIDQFVRKLKSLAKDCEFKSVSATEYQDECVRDAIINGLASTSIREKLLAQSELTLDQAYQLARSLELAHKQSQSYFYRHHRLPSLCRLHNQIQELTTNTAIVTALT